MLRSAHRVGENSPQGTLMIQLRLPHCDCGCCCDDHCGCCCCCCCCCRLTSRFRCRAALRFRRCERHTRSSRLALARRWSAWKRWRSVAYSARMTFTIRENRQRSAPRRSPPGLQSSSSNFTTEPMRIEQGAVQPRSHAATSSVANSTTRHLCSELVTAMRS